jgi:hypothetical protein
MQRKIRVLFRLWKTYLGCDEGILGRFQIANAGYWTEKNSTDGKEHGQLKKMQRKIRVLFRLWKTYLGCDEGILGRFQIANAEYWTGKISTDGKEYGQLKIYKKSVFYSVSGKIGGGEARWSNCGTNNYRIKCAD